MEVVSSDFWWALGDLFLGRNRRVVSVAEREDRICNANPAAFINV